MDPIQSTSKSDNDEKEPPAIPRYNLRKRKFRQDIVESPSISSPGQTQKQRGNKFFPALKYFFVYQILPLNFDFDTISYPLVFKKSS